MTQFARCDDDKLGRRRRRAGGVGSKDVPSFVCFTRCFKSDSSNHSLISLFLAVHRQDFEKRRKQHYKEFEAVKMARKLIEEEDEEEGDDDEDDLDSSKIIVVESSEVVLPPPLPGTLSMDTSPTEAEAAATVTGEGSSV